MRSETSWRRWLPLVLFVVTGSAAAQLSPLLLRGPYLQSPTPESIVVRWRTDFPTDSRVRYGTAPGLLDQEVTIAGAAVDHEVLLDNLAPATRYYYAVGSSLADLSSGPDHTFLTPPVAGTRQPVRIWTFGDSGWGTTPEEGIADQMRDGYLAFTGERGTDVWILLGDNAYAAGTDGEYQVNFFDLFSEVLRGVPVWSTFGNHENFVSWSRTQDCARVQLPGDECGPYYDMFTFPQAGEAGGVASDREAWHSFDYGNVHFINLNSQDVDRSPGSAMLTWLEEDLAANSQEWTIAYFHHPVYSNGTHPSDTDTGVNNPTPPTDADDHAIRQMRENVLPILEAGGVDLVLTAHSHNYERSFFLDGHYGTSDTLTEAMKVDPGDGRTDGDGPYRKAVGLFDDAHSGTVYAVVGTGAQFSVARHHNAIVATENRVGSLVIDVDGPILNATFVDATGATGDHFTIVRGLDNEAPYANDDAATTAPATPVVIDVLANDTDPEDDLLAIESVTQPALGTVAIEPANSVTYSPGPEVAEGIDSFTYTMNDGHGHAATATVTVTIGCPPIADGLFADDLEPEPEPGWSFETALNANPLSPTWHVREDSGAHSPTRVWFSESSDTTTVKDDRLITPPLDLSAASRLTFWHRYDFERNFDGGVLEISTDGGGEWHELGPAIVIGGYGSGRVQPLIGSRPGWTGVSGPPMSRVEVDLGAYAGPDRLIRWRLFADYVTLEPTVGWFVDDVEVTALVTGPGDCNLPPIARDDFAATESDTAVNIAVLANDSDPDGDPISLASVGTPANGTADAEADGTVTYTPDPGFAGADSFPYEISDGEATGGALVRITVTAPPGPTRARGNGTIDDDADSDSDAEFAFNARRDADGEVTGWLTYDTDDDSDSDSDGDSDGGAGDENDLALDGSVRELTFPGAGRVVLEGAGFLKDGRFVTFRATAEDRAHPGAGVDRFGIEIFDSGGNRIYAAEGAITSGEVVLD